MVLLFAMYLLVFTAALCAALAASTRVDSSAKTPYLYKSSPYVSSYLQLDDEHIDGNESGSASIDAARMGSSPAGKDVFLPVAAALHSKRARNCARHTEAAERSSSSSPVVYSPSA